MSREDKVKYDIRIEIGKVIDEKYKEIGMRYGKSKKYMEDCIEGLGYWYDGNIMKDEVVKDMIGFILMEKEVKEEDE